MSAAVFVYGAYGHTGRFVLAELRSRGSQLIVAGRDRARLDEVAGDDPVSEVKLDDMGSLIVAVSDAAVVLNCAGPFAETAAPLIDAAVTAGVPYLDVAGETDVVSSTFERFDDPARTRGVAIVPSASFYGALGDLLVSAAADGWDRADRVRIGYGLDSWKPTAGTRMAMERMGGRRIVRRGGELITLSTAPPVLGYEFPEPTGRRMVIGEYPGPESVLVPRHMDVKDVELFMTTDAIGDLRDPETSGPVVDESSGRSEQTFVVHTEVENGGEQRRAWVEGTDIYATTAPILVECMWRLLDSDGSVTGVRAPAELFEARGTLEALAGRDAFRVTYDS